MNPSTSSTLLRSLLGTEDPRALHDAWAHFVRLYTPLLLAWARNHRLQDADAADSARRRFLHLLRELLAEFLE
jgi:hypothetical protein